MDNLDGREKSTLFLICAEVINLSFYSPRGIVRIELSGLNNGLYSYREARNAMYLLQHLGGLEVKKENLPNYTYKEVGSYEILPDIKMLNDIKDSIDLEFTLGKKNEGKLTKREIIKKINDVIKESKSRPQIRLLLTELSSLSEVRLSSLAKKMGSKTSPKYAKRIANNLLRTHRLQIKTIGGVGHKPGSYQIELIP